MKGVVKVLSRRLGIKVEGHTLSTDSNSSRTRTWKGEGIAEQ